MGKDFFVVATGAFMGTTVALGLLLFMSMAAIQGAIDDRIAKVDAAISAVVTKVEDVGDAAMDKFESIKDSVKDSKFLDKVLN